MKRFFITLTAILLCIGAFAQSGATLKGDVNGDGKVDVEDVTSVVDIILSGKTYGYFYFGTTGPTAENFTSLPGAVASYTSIGEAVSATVSVAEGETLYMLCPAAWMKGKHVEVEDGEGNSYDFVEDTNAGTISGYVIYKTQAFNEATDAMLKFNNSSAETYYWYAGQTQPISMDSDPEVDDENFTNDKWHTIGTTLTNIGKLVRGGTAGNEWYVAVPKDKYQPTASDLSTPDNSWTIIDNIMVGNIQYSVYDTGIDLNRCATYLKVI